MLWSSTCFGVYCHCNPCPCMQSIRHSPPVPSPHHPPRICVARLQLRPLRWTHRQRMVHHVLKVLPLKVRTLAHVPKQVAPSSFPFPPQVTCCHMPPSTLAALKSRPIGCATSSLDFPLYHTPHAYKNSNRHPRTTRNTMNEWHSTGTTIYYMTPRPPKIAWPS